MDSFVATLNIVARMATGHSPGNSGKIQECKSDQGNVRRKQLGKMCVVNYREYCS